MNFRQEFRPTYKVYPKDYSDEPPAQLESNIFDRTQQFREFKKDTNVDTKYNSSCQFGVCVPGGTDNPQK